MKKEKSPGEEVLMKCFQKIGNNCKFEKRFPELSSVRGTYTRQIVNDYHTKNTAGGYSRNEYGKPFFS